jgi:hypothetical protein
MWRRCPCRDANLKHRPKLKLSVWQTCEFDLEGNQQFLGRFAWKKHGWIQIFVKSYMELRLMFTFLWLCTHTFWATSRVADVSWAVSRSATVSSRHWHSTFDWYGNGTQNTPTRGQLSTNRENPVKTLCENWQCIIAAIAEYCVFGEHAHVCKCVLGLGPARVHLFVHVLRPLPSFICLCCACKCKCQVSRSVIVVIAVLLYPPSFRRQFANCCQLLQI